MKKEKAPAYVNLAYEAQVHRLAQNENPRGASPKALEAVLKSTHKMSHYPDVIVTDMKNKLALRHKVTPREIIVSNGSGMIIDSLVQWALPNGYNMVVPEISFVAYKICAAIHQRECRLAAMDNYAISLDNMARLCDHNTRLVFLANPNNPTGTMLSHDEIEGFIMKMPAHTLVVLDEAYWEYVDDPVYPDSLALYKKYPNVMILHSFSKIYGLAGMRIGYGIAPKNIVGDLEVSRLPFTVGTVANIAALAALDDNEFVRESARINSVGRAYLHRELTKLGYRVIPSQGNFIYIHFPSTEDRDKMHDTLMANKMVVRKMEAFGDDRAIRISVGIQADNVKLVECLEK